MVKRIFKCCHPEFFEFKPFFYSLLLEIDRSGTVDINEFLFSIMGQEAANYGYLDDMERLEIILQSLLHGESAGAKEKIEDILKQGRAKETQIQ